jgi:fatty-acyl-CoA synthase
VNPSASIKPSRTHLGLACEPVRSFAEARALEAVPFDAYVTASSTFEALSAAARAYPDKLACRFILDAAPGGARRDFTYAELLARVVGATNGLRSLGVGRGDAVMILAAQGPETFVTYLAAQAVGVAMPTNPFLSSESLAAIASAGKARVVVTDGPGTETHAKGRQILQSPGAEALQLVAIEGEGAPLSEAWTSQAPLEILPGAGDTAACFHTGGTTGTPKLARLSHRNLLFSAWGSATLHGLSPEEVMPNGLPLFHVGGGVITTLRTLVLGQTLVQLTSSGFRDATVLDRFWELAEEHGFTQLIAVPTTYADLYRRRPAQPPARLRRYVASAAKLSPELASHWREALGVDIAEGYGMTECSGLATGTPTSGRGRAGSAGFPLAFVEVQIARLDEAGRWLGACPPGETGQILVCGPGVFQGYATDGDTAARFTWDDANRRWLVSGDVGRLDADGWLEVTGRAKDLIIRGGHNVDPLPIDLALEALPDVAAAAAVGYPDARLGELPVAFVELEPGRTADPEALRRQCVAALPERAGAPVEVFILPALPRTAVGKVFKPALRRQAAATAAERAARAVLGEAAKPGVTVESIGDHDWRVRVAVPPCHEAQSGAVSAAISLLNIPHEVEVSQ